MPDRIRLTKIVATWGPAVASDDRLRQLISAGVDVFRLNFSHGSHEEFIDAVPRIRAISEELGKPLALLQDIQGPRIRTGELPNNEPVMLENGSTVTISADGEYGSSERITVTYPRFAEDVQEGQRILIADGRIILRAERVSGREVTAKVIYGGELGEHKGVNLPDSTVTADALTDKDKDDLRLGAELGIDYIALSFVRRAADIQACRDVVKEMGYETPIISKIEHPLAIRNLEEILMVSDGVMVARGDLGVEVSPERVPLLQKQIIQRSNEVGIPVITATQMLESMVDRPTPTRAEASDVANAILDGTDALMLSAETAVGKYPVQTVETMARIANQAELAEHLPARFHRNEQPYLVARAAVSLAAGLDSKVILVFTRSGRTAQTISLYRPNRPVFAVTSSEATARKLAMWYAVTPMLGTEVSEVEEMLSHGIALLRERGAVAPGDTVVLMGSSPAGSPNLVNVRTVE